MRIILFYSGVESFNYFTDQIARELTDRGHEIFILDLRKPDASNYLCQVKLEKYKDSKIFIKCA